MKYGQGLQGAKDVRVPISLDEAQISGNTCKIIFLMAAYSGRCKKREFLHLSAFSSLWWQQSDFEVEGRSETFLLCFCKGTCSLRPCYRLKPALLSQTQVVSFLICDKLLLRIRHLKCHRWVPLIPTVLLVDCVDWIFQITASQYGQSGFWLHYNLLLLLFSCLPLSHLVRAAKMAEFEIISSVKIMGNPWESCHSWETVSAIHASTFTEKVHLLFYRVQLGSKAELMERRHIRSSGPPCDKSGDNCTGGASTWFFKGTRCFFFLTRLRQQAKNKRSLW